MIMLFYCPFRHAHSSALEMLSNRIIEKFWLYFVIVIRRFDGAEVNVLSAFVCGLSYSGNADRYIDYWLHSIKLNNMILTAPLRAQSSLSFQTMHALSKSPLTNTFIVIHAFKSLFLVEQSSKSPPECASHRFRMLLTLDYSPSLFQLFYYFFLLREKP